jgi:hypothetical protein
VLRLLPTYGGLGYSPDSGLPLYPIYDGKESRLYWFRNKPTQYPVNIL